MTKSFNINSIFKQNIDEKLTKSLYFEFKVTIWPKIMDARARILN